MLVVVTTKKVILFGSNEAIKFVCEVMCRICTQLQEEEVVEEE